MQKLTYLIVFITLIACSHKRPETQTPQRSETGATKSSETPLNSVQKIDITPSLCRLEHDKEAEKFIRDLDLWSQGGQIAAGKSLIDNALYLPTGDKKIPFMIISLSEIGLDLKNDMDLDQFDSLLILKEAELKGRQFLQTLHKRAFINNPSRSKVPLILKLKDDLDSGRLCTVKGKLKNPSEILNLISGQK